MARPLFCFPASAVSGNGRFVLLTVDHCGASCIIGVLFGFVLGAMLNKKNIFVNATALATGAMLIFVNTATANVNGLTSGGKLIVSIHDIIAVTKVDANVRD